MGLVSGPRIKALGLELRPRPQDPRAQQRANPTYWGIAGPGDLIPPRPFLRPNWPVVTNDTALRHSSTWACLRLRADLISTLPTDVFTRVNGVQVEAYKPPILDDPDGSGDGWEAWAYASQFDLDRGGNFIGIITATDGYGRPKRIEGQSIDDVTVQVRGGRLTAYKIGNEEFSVANGKIGLIWHEKAFTVPGMHIGLSPTMYARWALSEYLTVQEFATDFFGAGAVPKFQLKNKAKILAPGEAATIKEAWRAAVAVDEPFVTGADWDYQLIQATEASRDWIQAKTFSVTDICRYYGVPADMVDATPTGQTRVMTYANVQQRHLQLLIINIGPAVVRRERKLTRMLLPPGKELRVNTDALMRLDPQTRSQTIVGQVMGRVLAPSEGRELENRAPFTESQYAEFDRLFGPPPTGYGTYVPGSTGAGPSGFAPGAGALPAGDIEPTAIDPGPASPIGDVVPNTANNAAHNGHVDRSQFRELTQRGDWFR